MKKLLLILFFVPYFAFAAPVPLVLNFSGVSLITFAEATFKSILGRDYVISPDLVLLDRRITVQVKEIDPSAVPQFIEKILLKEGISVTLSNGIYYLDKVDVQNNHDDPSQSISVNTEKTNLADIAHRISAADDHQISNVEPDIRLEKDAESKIYLPKNRTADFMVTVINQGFGQKPAQLAGNRVIVTAPKTKLDRIFELIEQLDSAPALLDVSASWIEVTSTNTSGRGISLMANILGAKFGASLGTVNSGSAISFSSANFQAVLDFLNSDSRFRQVSNSRLVVDDYQKTNLSVGDEVPTISSTSKDNSGNPIQNVVYRPSGVIVELTPKVLGSGKINMTIDGQISAFKATVTGVSGSPTLSKRQVKTTVTVNDGEVLMIGGLNDTETTKSSSNLSFLPTSWASRNDSELRTDLVLLLTAKVTKQ